MRVIIRNVFVVNDGKIKATDILLSNKRIEKIAQDILLATNLNFEEINAEGLHLMLGIIDDQVYIREQGLTH